MKILLITQYNVLNIKNDRFSLFHHNCRGLKHNSSELFSLLDSILSHTFSIIGLSETHLNEFDHDLYNLDGYNHISNYRTERKCGGVSILVKDTFQYHERVDLKLMTDDLEKVFIETD